MYESITKYLEELSSVNIGTFLESVQDFVDAHPELELKRYSDILEQSGLKWDMESMTNADVSALDGKTVMALVVGAYRADRFCDGALEEFFSNGSMERWFHRLKEIDNNAI